MAKSTKPFEFEGISYDYGDGPWRETDQLSPEDRIKLQETFESAQWIFAKTMPWMPHWYTLLRQWQDRDLWWWCVNTMWRDGMDEKYGKRRYRVVILNGFKYWSCDDPVTKTDLINRKVWPVKKKP